MALDCMGKPMARRPKVVGRCFTVSLLHRFGIKFNHHVHLYACASDSISALRCKTFWKTPWKWFSTGIWFADNASITLFAQLLDQAIAPRLDFPTVGRK